MESRTILLEGRADDLALEVAEQLVVRLNLVHLHVFWSMRDAEYYPPTGSEYEG